MVDSEDAYRGDLAAAHRRIEQLEARLAEKAGGREDAGTIRLEQLRAERELVAARPRARVPFRFFVVFAVVTALVTGAVLTEHASALLRSPTSGDLIRFVFDVLPLITLALLWPRQRQTRERALRLEFIDEQIAALERAEATSAAARRGDAPPRDRMRIAADEAFVDGDEQADAATRASTP